MADSKETNAIPKRHSRAKPKGMLKKSSLKKLSLRAGNLRTGKSTFTPLQELSEDGMEQDLYCALIYATNSKRRTISLKDMKQAFRDVDLAA